MDNNPAESTARTRLLWPLLRPYRLHIAVALIAVSVAASTVLAFGWGLKNLVDQGFSDKSGHYLNQALLMLFGVILVLAAASYTRFYLVYWVAERATADLRKKIYRHLLTLDPAYFETHKTGDQVSRINTDTSVLQMVLTTNLPIAFRHTLTLLGGSVMLFIVSPVMTGMVLALVPIVIVPIVYFGRKVRSKSRNTQDKVGEMSSFSHETIQGLQTIQSFGYEETALSRFSTLADDTFRAALKYVKMRAFLTVFVISTVFSGIGIVLWMGGHRVLSGALTAGQLSAFIFYALVAAGAVASLSETIGSFNQAVGAADRIVALLLQEPQVKSPLSPRKLPDTVQGGISFDRVVFSYPTRPTPPALDKASFEIRAGETTALVGPSGAGKTTVFQLLQRFYSAGDGSIRIDGVNIADCDARDIRRHMGVVSQDPAIFSTSVADNIRMGNPEATDAEVRRAAELAQAHEFISELPEGYNTIVGERGSRLSGGQKQRLSIARVLLKNPRILLLDEATSALDSSNEQAVMLALRSLMQGRTTVVIAHRLSTVQNADKIIVLDQGIVVGEGTHEQLYGKNSLYTHLAGLQMQMKAG